MNTIQSGSLTLHSYRVRVWFSRSEKAKGYKANYSHVFLAENEAQSKEIALHSWSLDKRRSEETSQYAFDVILA